MKKIVLLFSILLLGACSAKNQEAANQTANNYQKTSSTKELKFVVAPQYEGKDSDFINLGKKLVAEHPEVGSDGNVALYFTNAITELDGTKYGGFMFINKTNIDIKKNVEFTINWSYDGKYIFSDQKAEYDISESGELPSYSATIMLLPLTDEQMEIVSSITDERKNIMKLSDVRSVN